MVKLIGGNASPVYVISTADLKQNGGRWALVGGAALPIYNLGESGLSNKFGDVDAGNYSEFEESTGFYVAFGEARGWIDYNFGIGALARGAAAPDLINLSATSIQTLGFNGLNTLEQTSIVLEMNHNWAEGTEIRPHVHWYPTTAAAGSVLWQLEYVFVFGAVVGASTTISVLQASSGVAWDSHFASFPAILTPGLTIGTQLHARLFRDPTAGTDDYGADAALATLGMHVLIDTLGSREAGTK